MIPPSSNGTVIQTENKLYTHTNYISNEASLETFKTYESYDESMGCGVSPIIYSKPIPKNQRCGGGVNGTLSPVKSILKRRASTTLAGSFHSFIRTGFVD